MISARDLTAHEAAALLHFYADAGVDALLEDAAIDLAARAETPAPVEKRPAAPQRETQAASPAARPAAVARPAIGTTTIPDDKAVSDAQFAAESARSLAELKTVLDGFSSCNLKHNARSTITLDAMPESGILAICGYPAGDDDRNGAPLAGRAGSLFERMLAAIGLSREDVAVTTALPWRTPGDRSPTQSEVDICRPFLKRQIALAEPRHLLVLGNFASRMLIDADKTVFNLRGEWHALNVDSHAVEALVTFSPTELLAAPANKKPAWQDLLSFRARLG
ncbi:uracil-DNA glycosylase [Martelella lutilitoris]|uniref:Type-4 uracil-DNA glycosylase n=1 Tax=Martelella lutilitoris TaxID=2583532 RepID=A0A5C4JQN4_9HYPH|nr:uracil-DNA glycosylase [Martelella lutilitoris]TNB46999.1 uracil-DNA glycosylase [Martelella lutilitoris]